MFERNSSKSPLDPSRKYHFTPRTLLLIAALVLLVLVVMFWVIGMDGNG